jgi:hypothetical protein
MLSCTDSQVYEVTMLFDATLSFNRSVGLLSRSTSKCNDSKLLNYCN